MLRKFQMSKVLVDKLVSEAQQSISEEEALKRKARNKRKARSRALRGKTKK